MDNRVDSLTRTIRLRAVYRIRMPSYLRMFAYVRIPVPPNPAKLNSKEAVLVPAEVVLQDIGGTYVWVVNVNIVERRTVRTNTVLKEGGARSPPLRQTVILEGLDGSESIIVSGLQRARDGAPVTPSAK